MIEARFRIDWPMRGLSGRTPDLSKQNLHRQVEYVGPNMLFSTPSPTLVIHFFYAFNSLAHLIDVQVCDASQLIAPVASML